MPVRDNSIVSNQLFLSCTYVLHLKVTALQLGVLCCFALFYLFDLACFFLSSFSSLIKNIYYNYYTYTCTLYLFLSVGLHIYDMYVTLQISNNYVLKRINIYVMHDFNYPGTWQNRDESVNLLQKHDVELIKDAKRYIYIDL